MSGQNLSVLTNSLQHEVNSDVEAGGVDKQEGKIEQLNFSIPLQF